MVALVSIYQITRERVAMTRAFPELRGLRRFGPIVLGIYILELAIALRLYMHVAGPCGLVYTMIGLYGYALGSSWNLLRARDSEAA